MKRIMKKLLFLALMSACGLGALQTYAVSRGVIVNLSLFDIDIMIDNAVEGRLTSSKDYHSYRFRVPRGRAGVSYDYPYDDAIVNYHLSSPNALQTLGPVTAGSHFIVKENKTSSFPLDIECTKTGGSRGIIVNVTPWNIWVTIENVADKNKSSKYVLSPMGGAENYIYPYDDAMVKYTVLFSGSPADRRFKANGPNAIFEKIRHVGSHFIVKTTPDGGWDIEWTR